MYVSENYSHEDFVSRTPEYLCHLKSDIYIIFNMPISQVVIYRLTLLKRNITGKACSSLGFTF